MTADTLAHAAERVVAAWHTRNGGRVTDAGWTPAEGALDDAIGALAAAIEADRKAVRARVRKARDARLTPEQRAVKIARLQDRLASLDASLEDR